MGFFDTILNLGKSAFSFFTGNGIGANLAKTALAGFALNQITKSINKDNEATQNANNTATTKVDPGTTIVIEPDQNNRIPVLYGEAFVPGIIIDAHLSTDQTTMTYVFTLCENTGTLLSTNTNSVFQFEDLYLNDQRVVFKSDGITIDYTLDREGNQDISFRDLITVRVYAGDSTAGSQIPQSGGFGVTQVAAYSVVPTWTSFHLMPELVFAVMTVKYNAEKGLKALPNTVFHMKNSMKQPGDCLYDYATNTRYGAGIAPEDIYDV